MQITVKFFAQAKALAGLATLQMSVPDGCSVREAQAALLLRYPNLDHIMPVLLIAIDGNYATPETPLSPDCELACFPPVSGG